MSYPAALASGVTAAARRLALQLATLDAKGIYTDVVREFTDFPQLLASAVGPFFKDFAPLGATLAELFIGPAPLKGHGVPDLADFVRRTTGGGYGGGAGGAGGVGGGGQKFAGEEGEFDDGVGFGGLDDEYDFGANVGGAPGQGNPIWSHLSHSSIPLNT